jgi:hypothetical protein
VEHKSKNGNFVAHPRTLEDPYKIDANDSKFRLLANGTSESSFRGFARHAVNFKSKRDILDTSPPVGDRRVIFGFAQISKVTQNLEIINKGVE